MTPRHHLDAATLVSHAAAALSPEMSAVAQLHLDACAQCRASLAQAEAIGGILIDQRDPGPSHPARSSELRSRMLANLDARIDGNSERLDAATGQDPDRLPAPLQAYFGPTWSGLKWRWMGPGMRYIRAAGASGASLVMLKIGPGRRMPAHGHGGSELTQILRGAYDDASGRFGEGDVADLDADTEHQPVTAAGTACICVSALDAPLRFHDWLARRLQPYYGI